MMKYMLRIIQLSEFILIILGNTDDDFLGMELQALDADFPVDLLER